MEFIIFFAFLLNEKRLITFIKRFFFLVLGDYYEILKEKENGVEGGSSWFWKMRDTLRFRK